MSEAIELTDFFQNINKNNLTKITWEHAVNNQNKLEEALKSDVQMLEADVQLGTLNNSSEGIIPIMAHPPNTVSDLSLNQFLMNVTEFNSQPSNKAHQKGIKLDFKTIQAYNESIPILRKTIEQHVFPLWVNADIVKGPGNPTATPVDPQAFLSQSKELKNVTLSIGWTTNYDKNTTTYTPEDIDSMLNIIKSNGVNQSISFPVRAVYVAQSYQQMHQLITNVTGSTLTIWSAENDPVNATQLRQVILDIGVDKVYIDVPKKLLNDLHLNSSTTRATSFGLLSIIFSTLFNILF